MKTDEDDPMLQLPLPTQTVSGFSRPRSTAPVVRSPGTPMTAIVPVKLSVRFPVVWPLACPIRRLPLQPFGQTFKLRLAGIVGGVKKAMLK